MSDPERATEARPVPALPAIPAPRPEPGAEPRPRALVEHPLALAVALLPGLAVRAWQLLSRDFPLNDGGLFYTMARDLQRAHYHLPAFTSYNGGHIPFGYSPLGFYAAALAADLTSLPLLDVFRWLPFLFNALILVAFALLARRLVASRAVLLAAVVAFGLVPRSFLWLLMGGGVTRSLGFLFALLALWQGHRWCTARSRGALALVALFAAGTAASHMGTLVFLVSGLGLLWLSSGGRPGALTGIAVAGVAAVALAAPWWASVVAVHGWGPFRAASATGGWVFSHGDLGQIATMLAHSGLGTGEAVLGVIAMLAALGFFRALARGDWLAPVWWLTIIVLDARQGSTFATVPIALLAGRGLVEVLLPALARRPLADNILALRPGRRRARATPAAEPGIGRTGGRFAGAVVALLFCFALGSALIRHPAMDGGLGDLESLSPAERAALAWVARATPPDARILVVGDVPWEIDRASEWLPALTGRRSVATVQGSEWLPDGAFRRKEFQYGLLQGCARWTTVCLRDWARAAGVRYGYVFLPRDPVRICCSLLAISLAQDSVAYRRVYDGPGAVIFERR